MPVRVLRFVNCNVVFLCNVTFEWNDLLSSILALYQLNISHCAVADVFSFIVNVQTIRTVPAPTCTSTALHVVHAQRAVDVHVGAGLHP